MLHLRNEEGEVNWKLFVQEMKSTIVEKYNNESLISYKGEWKQACKKSAKALNLKLDIPRSSNEWATIIESQLCRNGSENSLSTTTSRRDNKSQRICTSTKSNTSSGSSTPTRSSTSSLQYQKVMASKDIITVDKIYNKLSKKWTLSSGRKVEEIMHQACTLFKVEQ